MSRFDSMHDQAEKERRADELRAGMLERARRAAHLHLTLSKMADEGGPVGSHQDWDEFCRLAPADMVVRLLDRAEKRRVRIALDAMIAECTAPLPKVHFSANKPVADAVELGMRTNRLLAAILEKLHEQD